ncbi:hypothetical protein, partial [Paenibacillus solanacearum]|uniref:hypothetical protein n=1 Tax=Paenibacillus solanacearum TaxID=2048548 RepID=UPI001C405458
MNISGLLRGVMGDMKAGAPKTLELKTGEVVKGTVVQSISEQEALVNIGGVQVRARLEAPMKQGEVTMLQVQPPSDSGQVVLKPLNSSNVQIAEVSLGDVLKAVGLSDSPAQRQLVQLLHQAGIALTKENVQAFAGLAAQLPADVSLDEWLPSAVVAFQKGLPLTPETVTSVKQAVQGPPLHETLSQLAALAEQELGDSTELSPQTKELLRSVRQLVDQVRQTAGQLLKAESSATAASAGDAETVISGGQPQQGAAASAEPADGQMVRQGAGLPAAGGQLASVPPRAGAIPAAAEGMPAEGPPAGNKAASLTPSASPAQPESAAAGAAPKLAAAAGTPASQAGLPAAPKLAAAAGTPASQAGLPAAGQQGPASTGAPQAAGTGLS